LLHKFPAAQLSELAENYLNMNLFLQAKIFLEFYLKRLEALPEKSKARISKCNKNLGKTMQMLGKYEESISCFQTALLGYIEGNEKQRKSAGDCYM